MKKRPVITLITLLASQGGSAILGLVFLKLAVHMFPPQMYGQASLLLGIHNLFKSSFGGPISQALLIYYPDYKKHGQIPILFRTLSRFIPILTLAGAPLLVLMGWWVFRGSPAQVGMAAIAMGVLLWSDTQKTMNTNVLNAQEKHQKYNMWTITEAILRPMLLVVYWYSKAPRSALGLLVVYSLTSLAMAQLTKHDKDLRRPILPVPRIALHEVYRWALAHRAFLLPLAGLGIIGWFSAVGDRYFVNAFVGSRSVGLYAGIYGLFSAPFLILYPAINLYARPRLLLLLKEDHAKEAKRFFNVIFCGVFIGSTGLGGALFYLRHILIQRLLAPAYLEGLAITPGIILGYIFVLMGYTIEIQFYANKATSLIFLKQGIGALAAGISIPLMLHYWGLPGAGWACTLYFGVDFLTGAALLRVLKERLPAPREPADVLS